MIFSFLDLEKPIIARIPGPCIGLGASLALLCDIVYASENARIGDPHVKVGLVAGDGGVVAWPHLVGHARAKEYLMTGDLLTAAEAERIGLINHVVPEDELDTRVYAMAERLAGGATRAIRWTKTSINIGLKRYAHSVMDTCLGYEMLTFASNDHREAVDAFVNKRRPEFKGDRTAPPGDGGTREPEERVRDRRRGRPWTIAGCCVGVARPARGGNPGNQEPTR